MDRNTTQESDVDLSISKLHGSLDDPALASMNFLNEVANRYPEAVSFAPGRPSEGFFEVDDIHEYLQIFCRYLAEDRGFSKDQVRRTLYQYGRTKGVVHDLIAENLATDEGIRVDSESVVVTVGCQEAMFLVLRALCVEKRDVVLAASPTYVGFTGAARLVDMPVLPVATDGTGMDLCDLVRQVERAKEAGQRPRACYVMPDFANPSGVSMDEPARQRLLEIASEHDILLLEDNPYGLFHGDQPRIPTLKALDENRQVVYLGSFAKTILPGARIGYVVADQRVLASDGEIGLFADELSKIKSMLTVNTSPIAQAVVGGKLIQQGGTLLAANTRQRELYGRNLAQVLDGLDRRFASADQHKAGIQWNAPTGGFFAVVTVPFTVNDDLLEISAKEYGVLWTPMHHFYGGAGGHRQLRLSASMVNFEQIEVGLDRLAKLVLSRTDASA